MGRNTRNSSRSTRAAGDPATAGLGKMGFAALLIIAAILIYKSIDTRPPRPVCRYEVGVDDSDSFEVAKRNKLRGLVCHTFDVAVPSPAQVSLCTFGHSVAKCYSGLPTSSNELWTPISDACKSSSDGWGTYPSLFLREALVEARAAKRDKQDVIILVVTDGEDADPDATRAAVAELAAMPNVRAVWIAGVNDDFRLDTERRYGALGARLIVTGELDPEQGARQINYLMEDN